MSIQEIKKILANSSIVQLSQQISFVDLANGTADVTTDEIRLLLYIASEGNSGKSLV